MKTEIYKLTGEDQQVFERVGEIIRQGGIAAIPTETVYGLAGNALDGKVVRKIYEAKGRPSDNPLIVHISRYEQWAELVREIPEQARLLAEHFWPGPLTIILEKSSLVPEEVSGGLDTVAVRMPLDERARALIDAAGVPLAAPSANLSGKPSPTLAEHVIEDLQGRIDAIIDAGPCSVGIESTVVSLHKGVPRILRPGGITPEELYGVLGSSEIDPAVYQGISEEDKVSSPGMKYKHYSPSTELILVKGEPTALAEYISRQPEASAVLCFEGEQELFPVKSIAYGKREDSSSQAARLFDALRELDSLGVERAYALCPSDKGIGLGVYNRLLRACGFNILEL